VTEVIGHSEELDAPPIGQAVADEVHAPGLVDVLRQLQRHVLIHRPLALPAPTNGQVGLAVEPIDAFMVHAGELGAQHVVDAPAAKAPARMRNLDDLAAAILVISVDGICGVCSWWRSYAVSLRGEKYPELAYLATPVRTP
jgi:hypothetical protein